MIAALVSFVMLFVGVISTAFFGPISTLFSTTFPVISSLYGYIADFIDPILYYSSFVAHFLGFTTPMLSVLLNFFLAHYIIYLSYIVIRFAINIYDKLKP